jgi:single-strand DNA-binding protein
MNMSDFNRVILMGRIGNDLELKTSAQGKPYLKISLATHSFKSAEGDGQSLKTTHWHRVMVFGHQAEVCAKYLQKGAQVMVEGTLEVRTYTDKDDRKVTRVSVIAFKVNFFGGRMEARTESPMESPREFPNDSDDSLHHEDYEQLAASA